MVDALKPSGSYPVIGDIVKVSLRLIRNKTPVATLIVEDNIENKRALINKIVATIIQAATTSDTNK